MYFDAKVKFVWGVVWLCWVVVGGVSKPISAGNDGRVGFPAGTPIQIYNCTGPAARQVWFYDKSSQEILLAQAKPNCLDCAGCGDQSLPHLWDCGPVPNENQAWIYNNSQLQSKNNPQYCLSAVNLWANPVVMVPCSATDEFQKWVFRSDGRIYSPVTDFCLDGGTPLNVTCKQSPLKNYPYCNSSLDPETRARDLVSRLNVLEIAGNLVNNNFGIPRLAVPRLVFGEALHGVIASCGTKVNGNTGCPTSFPHGLALGATFNRTLWKLVGTAISTEARALNNQQLAGLAFWAPDINLFRDPRWGRGQEVPGEDPFLTGEYVMHYSRAMQEGEDPKYLKVVSTAKHYADYDLEGNHGVDRGSFDAVVSTQDQVEYYWPAFRAAVEGAHVQSIMCSYNSVNFVPSCGNSLFMNTVARDQWQFDGFIVSDCGAIGDGAFTRYINKFYNGSKDAQVTVALEGGCDLNCGDYYRTQIPSALKNGVLSQTVLNNAFVRVWKHAIRLGLLDDPSLVSYTQYGPELIDSPEHRALALNAAQQAITLLQNNNNLLPLALSTKVALIGPHFNVTDDMLSNYHGDNTLVYTHSPLLAFKSRGANIVAYAQGCDLESTNTSGFAAAIKAAQAAEVAIVFIGLSPNAAGDARENEGWDRLNISLPGVQNQLVQQIVATNTPTVVVLINGGPLAIRWIKDNVPAIVEAWYPGELGGDAIASIIFGDVSPAGRLPVTIYDVDLISTRDISDMSLRDKGGITYRYYQGTPLWEFGFGLSYTTFRFNWSSSAHAAATTHEIQSYFPKYYARRGVRFSPPQYVVEVTNTGNRFSDCVVLAFVSSDHPDAPLKELFGYERVSLKPGQSTTVYFSAPPSVLALVDSQGNEKIHPGVYHITIGDSLSVLTGTLTLTGPIVPLIPK